MGWDLQFHTQISALSVALKFEVAETAHHRRSAQVRALQAAWQLQQQCEILKHVLRQHLTEWKWKCTWHHGSNSLGASLDLSMCEVDRLGSDMFWCRNVRKETSDKAM